MKVAELRQLKEPELQGKLGELSKDVIKLRAQVATGAAPKNAGQIKRARRTVARIMTILNERRDRKNA